MSLAVLVPVLGRPHRVRPLLDSLIASDIPERTQVLFLTDPDDLDEEEAIEQAQHELGKALPISQAITGGNYAHKINQGVRLTKATELFLGADDLHFEGGWYAAASARLTGRTQVVGVNDMCSQRVMAGHHATHFLMDRPYAFHTTIDGLVGPLCELYAHNYVDDELVGTARKRRVLDFATDSVVRHLHPDNTPGGWEHADAIYRKGRASMKADRRIYRQRRTLWR